MRRLWTCDSFEFRRGFGGWIAGLRRKGSPGWAGIALAVCLVLAAAGGVAAQGGGYELAWWTVDGGGATLASGPGYSLGGTLGQPDAGVLSGPGYRLAGGFWPGGPGGPGIYRVYLPLAAGSYP